MTQDQHLPGDAPLVTDEMINDLTFWEMTFQQMNFPGMDLVEATAYPLSSWERIAKKKQYSRIKRDFIRYVAYNSLNDLRNAGLDEESIFYFKKGILPENFNIHIKIPVDYTGEIDFSNLVLMQTLPYHEDIHKFIDMQMAGMPLNIRPRKLYIPVPIGRVYIPLTTFNGSGGKNKQDRSVQAGFSAEALQSLQRRTMVGGR